MTNAIVLDIFLKKIAPRAYAREGFEVKTPP